jgi:hypothetical protein
MWKAESGVSRTAMIVLGSRAAAETRSWCGGGGALDARKGTDTNLS